jgi:hypothetical protein
LFASPKWRWTNPAILWRRIHHAKNIADISQCYYDLDQMALDRRKRICFFLCMVFVDVFSGDLRSPLWGPRISPRLPFDTLFLQLLYAWIRGTI